MATRFRVGNGFDFHPLEAGRRLVLGGVEIKHDKGLRGHSDADVAAHALANAILGAIGAGDLGRHFPDRSPLQKRRLDCSARECLETSERPGMASRQRRPDDLRRAAETEAASRCDAQAARVSTRRRRVANKRESLKPRRNQAPWAAAKEWPQQQ